MFSSRISYSDDGIGWELPLAITDINEERTRYPNLISDDGNTIGGKKLKLYYARNQNSMGIRQIAVREIIFN